MGDNFIPGEKWKEEVDNPPSRPITAPIFPSRAVVAVETPLSLAPFSKEILDQGLTAKLFASYFKAKEKPPTTKVEAPTCPSKKTLGVEEQDFFGMLEAEFGEFAKDFQKGEEINSQRKVYDIQKPKDLRDALEAEITKWDGEIADLEASILELANKHDPDALKQTLYKEGKIEKEISLKQLAALFLQGDADAFARANPFLRDERLINAISEAYGVTATPTLVIDYLYNKMGLYMTQFVHRAHLQRAVKLCKDVEKATSLKRQTAVQKLADEMNPIAVDAPIYSIREYPPFLVFEYMSGLSIRGEQAHLFLKKLLECPDGKYINRVIQLIMGGGKTAVMAVVLLKLAARKGRLSLFVTPASQYASVSYNLRKTLHACFGIDMEEIDVSREQLATSPTMCSEVLKRLEETIRAGDFLLIKAETLQTLSLAFLDFLYKAAKDPERDPELIAKINTLKKILIIFKEQGDALFDEVDLVLNVLQEVNFPVGDKEFLDPERIEVIRELFLLFTGQKVALNENENINLREEIGLIANRQNLLSPKKWKNKVAKAVAYNFTRNLASLKLQGRLEFGSSFERYINGSMKVHCQELLDQPNEDKLGELNPTDRLDYQFLSYVRDLSRSDDPTEQEAAHHIALVRSI